MYGDDWIFHMIKLERDARAALDAISIEDRSRAMKWTENYLAQFQDHPDPFLIPGLAQMLRFIPIESKRIPFLDWPMSPEEFASWIADR